MRANQIVSIAPLAGLTALKYLNLSANQITDLKPLVTNAGLTGAGDSVEVLFNAFTCDATQTGYLQTLKNRLVVLQQPCNLK